MNKKQDDQVEKICREFFARYQQHIHEMKIKKPQMTLAISLTQMVGTWANIEKQVYGQDPRESIKAFKESLDIVADNFFIENESLQ